MKIIIESQQDINNFKLLSEMAAAISLYVETKGIGTYNIDLSRIIDKIIEGINIEMK